MHEFTKKYQVWLKVEYGYTFTEHDSLHEALAAPKYVDWYITKRVIFSVQDTDELPAIPQPNVIQPQSSQSSTGRFTEAGPADGGDDPVLAAYLAGGTGTVQPDY